MSSVPTVAAGAFDDSADRKRKVEEGAEIAGDAKAAKMVLEGAAAAVVAPPTTTAAAAAAMAMPPPKVLAMGVTTAPVVKPTEPQEAVNKARGIRLEQNRKVRLLVCCFCW